MTDTTNYEPIMLDEKSAEVLRNMAHNLDNIQKELNRAKRAGLDVADLQEKFNKSKTIRSGLLREYTK